MRLEKQMRSETCRKQKTRDEKVDKGSSQRKKAKESVHA